VLWVRCERGPGLVGSGVWELGAFLLVVGSWVWCVGGSSGNTLREGSRAGYREFSKLRGRGKGVGSGRRGELERGFDRTRVRLSRGESLVSIGVLGREISANPHFLGRVQLKDIHWDIIFIVPSKAKQQR